MMTPSVRAPRFRFVFRAPLVAVVALLLAGVSGCEEQGIPAVPAKDDPAAKPAAPEATGDAQPTASAAADADDKTAKAAEGEGEGEGDAAADGSAKAADADKPATATDTKTAADPKAKPDTKTEPEPEPQKGEKKTEGSYAAWLQSSGKYAVDKPGAVVAVVSAQGEFKVNDKYPYKFKLGGSPAGVTFAGDTFRGASLSQKQASLSIPFTPTSAGAKTISGTFFFSVCNEETCHIKKQPLSVTINVD